MTALHEPNREYDTLRRTFHIYAVTPCREGDRPFINQQQLHRFFIDLSQYATVLRDVDWEFARAFFSLINVSADGKLSFDEFVGWWKGEYSDRSRYELFTPSKRRLVIHAWRLFHRFAIGNTVPYRMFDRLMTYMKVTYSETDFDALDTNLDGVLSFSEFCSWLKWF